VTTLASYTFPSGSNMSGAVVRGYATGRYVNGSGASISPTIVCTANAVSLISIPLPVPTTAPAYGWQMQVHFYFTQALPQTGNQLSVGATMNFMLGNAGTTVSRTSAFVTAAPFQVYARPFTNFVDTTQTIILTMQFNAVGVGGEILETGCAYLEGL
jgi:hypothetical protein